MSAVYEMKAEDYAQLQTLPGNLHCGKKFDVFVNIVTRVCHNDMKDYSSQFALHCQLTVEKLDLIGVHPSSGYSFASSAPESIGALGHTYLLYDQS